MNVQMLSAPISKIIANWKKGYYSDTAFVAILGADLAAEEVASTLAHLPDEFGGEIKRRVARRVADNERLEPKRSPFCNPFGQYYCNVALALGGIRDVPGRVLLSVYRLPSFQAEWGLQLARSKEEYSLTLNVAEAQIWGADANVGVRRCEARLPSEVANLVLQAWQVMLSCVRYPESPRMGLDGIAYHFDCEGPNGGQMAGMTWSPDISTAPGRLVALSHLLFRYADNETTKHAILLGEIQEASSWFQKLSIQNDSADIK